MLHLRTRLLQYPPKRKLDVLHQMTRKLDVTDVRRMIQRSNVVVLQYTRGVEVVNKAARALPSLIQRPVVEVLDYILDLIDETAALLPGVPDLAEALPEREDDDLGVGPAGVDLVDKLDVAAVEFRVSDIVDSVVVVGTEIDDGDVGSRVGGEVPVGDTCWVYV